MTQAIRTVYKSPTNTKPAYMLASCEAKTLRVSYDHEKDIDDNHKAACQALLGVLGWKGDYVGGQHGDYTYWVDDDNRLASLKGIVNSMRIATWSGNPWCKPEFKKAVLTIGHSVGYRGDYLSAPTTEEELKHYK